MKKKLLLVTAILLVTAVGAFAAEVTGKWTIEAPWRGGEAAAASTITLKAEGGKLTGFAPPGENATPAEISNAKIEGDKVTFEVKLSFGGYEFITKYEGIVSGDQMKLKIERPAWNAGDVPPPPQEVTAKRE